jgi:hypothetical protein
VDITSGRYVLKMNRFDGAKMPYVSSAVLVEVKTKLTGQMYLQAKPPNMMPTQILTGTNVSFGPYFDPAHSRSFRGIS